MQEVLLRKLVEQYPSENLSWGGVKRADREQKPRAGMESRNRLAGGGGEGWLEL